MNSHAVAPTEELASDDHHSDCLSRSTGIFSPGRHISQLDGLRGVAILIVTLFRFSRELPAGEWSSRLLGAMFAFGERGVELFFVLSGFLITGILLDAKGSRNYLPNFLARRALRIFPLYFSALFLFVVVVPWMQNADGWFAEGQENQIYLWTYLTNVKMSLEGEWCFGYLDHFWSLSVEEHFYLMWPIAVLLCSRKRIWKFTVAAVFVCAGSRFVFAGLSANGVAPDVFSVFRFDALLIGGWLALQIRSPQGLQPLRKWTLVAVPVCIAIGLTGEVTGRRLLTASHTIWPVLWACVLIWLLSGSERDWLARIMDNVVLRKLGKYSYAMYVFQSPLIPIVAVVVSAPALAELFGSVVLANLAYIALMFGVTYVVAWLSWYGLESHFLGLKKYFPSGGESSSSVAASVPQAKQG